MLQAAKAIIINMVCWSEACNKQLFCLNPRVMESAKWRRFLFTWLED